MAETGWGNAEPVQYMQAPEAQGAPVQQEWGNAQPAEYMQVPEGVPAQPSGLRGNPTQPAEYMQAPHGVPAQQPSGSRWGNPAQPAEYMQLQAPQPVPSQIGGASSGKVAGIVKKWFHDKGFGFITKQDGSDVFVHHSAVYALGKASLDIGESVEFNVIVGDDGREKASDVTGSGGVHVRGSSDPYGGGGGGGGQQVCHNFQRTGECRFGTSCRFVHGNDGGGASYGGGGGGYSGGGGSFGGGGGFGGGRKKPCFNFQNNGHCKFGEGCRFAHE